MENPDRKPATGPGYSESHRNVCLKRVPVPSVT